MLSYQYTITNKKGDSIILNDHTDPYSVYALQDYPKFSKNIKNNEMERTGQNNYWDFYSYNGKMSLSFSGVIVANSHQELEQKKNLMQTVFAIPLQSDPLNDGYVTITWTDDDGIDKQIEAKLYQDISFNRKLQQRTVMDFQIQLKCKNNYVSNQAGYTVITNGLRGYFLNGFTLPTLLPITFTSGYQNIVTINITATGALPKIKLYGENQLPITNPRVLNIDTGEVFQLDMVLNGASDWVEINTEDGTVLNQSGVDVSGYINLSSSFLSLSTGANNLVYLSDEDLNINGILPESGTHIEVSYKELYAS